MTDHETLVHLRTCSLCEAMCGLEISVAGGRGTGIRPDRDDVWSRGYMCPKGAVLGDLHADPDRLRAPLVRRGDTWVTLTWAYFENVPDQVRDRKTTVWLFFLAATVFLVFGIGRVKFDASIEGWFEEDIRRSSPSTGCIMSLAATITFMSFTSRKTAMSIPKNR